MLLHSPAWCRIQIGTDTDVRYEPLSDRIPNRIASSAAQFNHILSVIAARRRDKTLLLVGQFLLMAVVQERQLIVTEPEEMQQRRLEIVVADLVNHRAMAEVTGR